MGWEHETTEKACFCGQGKIFCRFSSDDFLNSKYTEWLDCGECKSKHHYVDGRYRNGSDEGYWASGPSLLESVRFKGKP